MMDDRRIGCITEQQLQDLAEVIKTDVMIKVAKGAMKLGHEFVDN